MRAVFVTGCAVVISGAIVVAAGCQAEFPDLVEVDSGASGKGGTGGGSAGAGSGGIAGGGGSAGATTGGSGGVAGSPGGGGVAGAATGGAGGTEPSGLLGYWPFDDNTSNVAKDLTGNPPHDGAFALTDASWVSDPTFGTVLTFNDGNGVSMPGWSNAEFPLKGTISVWVKLDVEIVETKNRGIFDNWNSGRDHVYIRRSNGETTFPPATQGGFYGVSAGLIDSKNWKIQNKTWKYVAIGWDTENDTGFYYADDAYLPEDMSKDPNWTPNQQSFVFGDKLTGQLAEARLYDHLLSQAELDQIAVLQHQ
jgi:hypothetical protein